MISLPAKLRHKRYTQLSDLIVTFTLRVKVATTLSTTHHQSCQSVLKRLLKAEELKNGEVDCWMESEASFVWTQCGVELSQRENK